MEKGMMALKLFKDRPDPIKTLIQLGQQNNETE